MREFWYDLNLAEGNYEHRRHTCSLSCVSFAPQVPYAHSVLTAEFRREDEAVDPNPVAVRRITPFVRPAINPDQLPPDYLALLSLTFGVAGLMLKVRTVLLLLPSMDVMLTWLCYNQYHALIAYRTE